MFEVKQMSLVTLTFGGRSTEEAEHIGKGRVRVSRTEKFFGTPEVCIMGRLVEGAVSKNMALSGKENCFIKSVESNYGEGACTREGSQIVLMVSGIMKSDVNSGDELIFEKMQQAIERPKGRVIIA